MSTKIVLNRKKEMANRIRKVQVLIDGVESGEIVNGSSEGFEVTPGVHTIQCKVSRFSSEPFTVNIGVNETKFLQVRSGMKYYTIGYILVLVALISVLVFRLAHIPLPSSVSIYQLLVMTPFVLYVLYYSTLGRKRYLVLGEDNENIFK